METETREFKTSDLYMSAALSIWLNQAPQYKVENNRTLFVFPISDNLYRAMNDFNSGKAVSALQYSLVLKKLRGEMLQRRSGNGEQI